MGAVLSAAMMLDEISRREEARLLEAAVVACVAAGRTTRDLGGGLGTREVGEEIRRRIRQGPVGAPKGEAPAGPAAW